MFSETFFRKFRWQTPVLILASLLAPNDRAYGQVFTARIRAMGIRDRPIAPASPWHNGIAERLIGTLRRECLDPPIWHITIRLARIWLYTKMRP